MDDVIQYYYGFSRGTIGYRYVRYCMKHKVIVKPWHFLRDYEPTTVSCSMVGHLSRAVELLEENHNNFKSI
jgi:hypothetical protein